MNFVKFLCFAFGLMLVFPIIADAQQNTCQKREVFVKYLEEGQFKENQKVIAIIDEKKVIEIFSNDDTGTWTAFVTHSNGTSCPISGGQHFMIVKQEPPEPPGIDH